MASISKEEEQEGECCRLREMRGDRLPGWVGVDLDGTLAEALPSFHPEIIGRPLEPMMEKVKEMLLVGYEVRIFTARATMGAGAISAVKAWLHRNGLPDLPVTATKDAELMFFYDDRAIQVEHNTGRARWADQAAYFRRKPENRR